MLISVEGCFRDAGLRLSPWPRVMPSRCLPLPRVSLARSCCCRFRSAFLPCRPWLLPRPTCSTTSSRPPVPCIGTGGRSRPVGASLWSLIAGTLPGVITGSVIRVELLPGPRVFNLMVAAVLVPPGTWLVLTPPPARSTSPVRPVDPRPGPGRLGSRGGLRRRHLRDRRRRDLGTDPDRHGPSGISGRSRRAGSDVRNLSRRGHHLHSLGHLQARRRGS